jgi:hypothetical protein
MATVALSGIITPTNVVTATSTTTLTNKTLTGAVVNGTVGATTPSTGAFTTLSATDTLSVVKAATTTLATFNTAQGRGIEVIGGASDGSTGPIIRVNTGAGMRLQSSDSTTRAFIDSTGLAVTGLVDISAATSGQIKFPATQNASANANTLDDYEEGTWTPNVGGTSTYNSQLGKYTKIGNLVTIMADFSINVIGTGSTTDVGSAPFGTSGDPHSGCVGYYNNLATSVTGINCYITNSTPIIKMTGTNAAATNVTQLAAFGNSARVAFTISYFVS